jgi:hypothetical protein
VLGIHSRGFPRGNAKKVRIKLIDVLDKSTPSDVGPAGYRRIRIVESIQQPTIGWNFRNGVDTVCEQSPEIMRIIDVAGKTAANTNDGNRFA